MLFGYIFHVLTCFAVLGNEAFFFENIAVASRCGVANAQFILYVLVCECLVFNIAVLGKLGEAYQCSFDFGRSRRLI